MKLSVGADRYCLTLGVRLNYELDSQFPSFMNITAAHQALVLKSFKKICSEYVGVPVHFCIISTELAISVNNSQCPYLCVCIIANGWDGKCTDGVKNTRNAKHMQIYLILKVMYCSES